MVVDGYNYVKPCLNHGYNGLTFDNGYPWYPGFTHGLQWLSIVIRGYPWLYVV